MHCARTYDNLCYMKRDNSYLIGNQYAKGAKPNKTAFKKGNRPWNKGIKGLHLSPATEFKKGQRSINWQSVGSLVIRTSKKNKQRWHIKVANPNKWILYAVFVWEKYNGLLPKGKLIHHKDENTLNDNIENLQAVTRGEHINIHRPQLLLAKRIKNHSRIIPSERYCPVLYNEKLGY